MCLRAKFHPNRPNGYGDITIFRFSRWLPSAILDFEIVKLLAGQQVWSANMHRHAKFHQNRSNSLTFFKIATVCHLGFLKK